MSEYVWICLNLLESVRICWNMLEHVRMPVLVGKPIMTYQLGMVYWLGLPHRFTLWGEAIRSEIISSLSHVHAFCGFNCSSLDGCRWYSNLPLRPRPADVLSSLPLFIRLWDSMSKGSILFTCAMDDGINVICSSIPSWDSFQWMTITNLRAVRPMSDWVWKHVCWDGSVCFNLQGQKESCAIAHKHT